MKLDDILDKAGDFIGDVAESAQKAYETASEKVKQTYETIDERADAEHVKEAVKEGYEGIKGSFMEGYGWYNNQMDEWAHKGTDGARWAGMVDGFMWVNFETPADRRPRSEIYNQNVQYGKVLGGAASLALLWKGRLIASALPTISRTVKYGPTVAKNLKKRFDMYQD